MSAPVAGNFQDHYLVLGVEANASSEAIQKAYSTLAARYHANSKDTADPEKFQAVTLAFEVLSDPSTRRMFDDLRPKDKEDTPEFRVDFFEAIAKEHYRRLTLLCMLYDRRRDRPVNGCLSMRHIEQMTNCTSEQLQLSIWYLKQRGYIVTDDKSNLQISVDGMDYLEQNVPPAKEILAMLKSHAAPAMPAPATPPPSEEETPHPPELAMSESVSLSTRRLAMALKR